MTREINFRAWDEAAEDWFYFNLIPFFPTDLPHLTGERFKNVFEGKIIDPSRVCLGTCLKDEYGTRIYQGDILAYTMKSKLEDGSVEIMDTYYLPQAVEWDKETAGFKMRGFNRFGGWGFKVVGNIYENPELLRR